MASSSDLSLRFRTVGTRQAARSVDSVRRPVRGLGDDANRTGSAFRRQGKSVGVFSKGLRMVKFAAIGATTAVGGVASVGIKSGIQLNAQWQGLQTTFKTLLGSSGAAEKYVESLRQVSKGTPFKLTDIAEASQQLLGVGMSADEAAQQMENIRNVALGSGKGIEGVNRITDILASIQARGKISQVEMNRLAQAGVPINEILEERLGLTAEQTAAIGKEGIAAEKVFDALNKGWGAQSKYGKAAANAANDFNNQIANIKKDTEFFLRTATFPIFDRLNKVVMPQILDSINAMSTGFEQGGMDGAFAALDKSVGAGGKLIAVWNDLKLAGESLWAVLRDVGLPILNDIWGVVSSLPNPLSLVADALGFVADNTRTLAVFVKVALGAYLAYRAVLVGVAAWELILTTRRKIAAGVLAAQNGLIWAQLYAEVALTKAKGLAALAQRGLNAAMKANPILLVISLIAALAGGVVLAYKKFEWFRKIVDGAWGVLKSIGRWIMSNWRVILIGLTGPLGAAIVLIVDNFGRIKSAVTDTVNWVKTAFGDMVNFVKELPGKIAEVARGMWDGIVSGARAAVNLVIKGLNLIIKGINKVPLLPNIGLIDEWEAAPELGSTPGVGNVAGPALMERGTGGMDLGGNLLTRPGAALGARVQTPGLHWVGENGPELRWSAKGDRIMDHRSAASLVGRGQQAPQSMSSGSPEPLIVNVQVDSDTIARAVVKDARRKRARR